MPVSAPGLILPSTGETLSTRLDGSADARALLVFGHGAGAGIDHPSTARLAAAIAARNVTVMRFQFPFMERRGGRGFGRDPLAVGIEAVGAAVACARDHAPGTSLFVGGHSYGGRIATHAVRDPELAAAAVNGIVCLSFPLHGAGRPAIEKGAHLRAIAKPMLFVSGARDAMACPPMFEALVAQCVDASLHRVEGADHGWKAGKRRWPRGPEAHVGVLVADWILARAG